MIPKMEFRYSWIYDIRLRDSPILKRKLKKQGKSYPSERKILNYIKEIEKIWKRQGDKILREISKVSGLKWREKKIICYVRGFGRPFSDPLSMRLFKNKNDFIDTLTHELIHQIQIQDGKNWYKWWKYLTKTYSKEPIITKSHISVHAIHWKLILNIFDEKRLKKEIKNSFRKEYKRAWEIVEKEGSGNIIKEFKKRIK